MTITNQEKIKELIGEETSKRKEIEKAKEELEKKKKEIEDLEKKKTAEISAARKQLQSKIEEMVLEEQKDFQEQEEARTKRERDQEAALEEKIEEAPKKSIPNVPRGYGDAINEVMRGAPTFYSLTDYNVMNRLESIANDSASRPLTSEESAFVSVFKYEASSMMNNSDYASRQGSQYLRQGLHQIDKILNISRQKEEEMKKGDYNV